MVEISNEASLLAAWVRQRWHEQALPPAYEPILRARWNDWLVRRHGSLQAACLAWDACPAPLPAELPLPAPKETGKVAGRIERLLAGVQDRLRTLAPADLDEAWQDGDRRLHDFLAFLADTDRAYLDRLRAAVHAETDALVPVAGTQMSYGGVLNFDSHAAMDYVDDHQYIDHPFFPLGSSEQRDWSIRRLSLTGGEMDTLLRLAFRRDSRKPFVLSEFNLPFPNPRGAEVLPVVAAVAALQDWDGLFFFDYLDAGWPRAPANFTLSGDWGKYVLAGQSALLFRQPGIEPLPQRVEIPLPRAVRMGIAATGRHDGWERAVAQAGIVPADALRWRLASDVQATVFSVVDKPATQDPPSGVHYDAERRRLVLDTPFARGYFGAVRADWQGSDAFQARLTAGTEAAPDLMLTALDEVPVAQSRHLLLTVGSATVGTQPGSMPPRPKQLQRYKNTLDRWTLEPDPDRPGSPSGARHAQAPAWLSRPALCVRWQGRPAAATVYPLDEAGRRTPALAAEQAGQDGGTVALDLAGGGRLSPWYEIVLAPADPPSAGAPIPARCAG